MEHKKYTIKVCDRKDRSWRWDGENLENDMKKQINSNVDHIIKMLNTKNKNKWTTKFITSVDVDIVI